VIENKNDLEVFSKFDTYFTKFLNTNALKLSQNITTHDETIVLVGSKIIAYVLKSDVIDPLMEKQALMKQQKDLENEIKRSESLLQNEKFISKAPESKINLEKEKYEDYKKQYEIVVEKLKTYV
jgi:valyl-tRNA synthetase